MVEETLKDAPQEGVTRRSVFIAFLCIVGISVAGSVSAFLRYDLIGTGHLPRCALYPVLLLLAVGVLGAGLASGGLGVREGLFVAAPVVQWLYYRPRFTRGLTSADCILATHLGTGMLCLYLAGTSLWLRAGLPENIFLVGG